MIDHPNASNQKSCTVAVPRQRNHATFATCSATHSATDAQLHASDTGDDAAQRHESEPNYKGYSDIKALASAVLERNKSRNRGATASEKQCNFPPSKNTAKVARLAEPDKQVAQLRCLGGATAQLSKDAADMTDHERGLLVAMGLRWRYSTEDWQTLWSDCQDPAKRAAWLRTAEGERPLEPEQEGTEPAVTIHIEADIGSGRKVFDLAILAHRWDEAAFGRQIANLQDAQWWQLGLPRRCADCRHAQPTQHAALVRCDQRDDYPACGSWWADDSKPCSEWAPANRPNTQGQQAETEREHPRQ